MCIPVALAVDGAEGTEEIEEVAPDRNSPAVPIADHFDSVQDHW
jgi:hypothetical protein